MLHTGTIVTSDAQIDFRDRWGMVGSSGKPLQQNLKLFQKEVAKAIVVDTLTICNWENNLTNPRLYLLPRIFKFLGYDPLQSNATTMGERIRQYRIQAGLSLRKLAKGLGIDPATLARWERGESQPRGKLKKRINSFLNILAG